MTTAPQEHAAGRADSWAGWPSAARRVALRGAGALERPAIARSLLGLVSVAYAVAALWLTRSTTAFVDEIAAFAQDGGLHPSALLAPLNGHLTLFQRAVYDVDWRLLGPNYAPLRVLEVVGVIVVAWEVFALMAGRVGPAIAALLASLLLLLGSAWELNFVVSGLGNVAALAFGLGGLMAVERGTRRGDLAAGALLLCAVASFTLALAIVAGIAARLALTRGGARRLWVILPAGVAWIGWFAWVKFSFEPAHAGATSSLLLGNAWIQPQAVLESAVSTVGALTGTNYPIGDRPDLFQFETTSELAAPMLAVAIVWAAVRVRRRPGLADPALVGALTMAVAFWVILSFGYGIVGRGPNTVRYVYAGSVFFLLAATAIARNRRPSRGAILAVALLVVCSSASNLMRLRDGMAVYRPASLALRGVYAGIDVAGAAAHPDVTVGYGPLAFIQPVAVGPYLQAARRLGSPGWSPTELVHRPEAERAAADASLVNALGLHLELGPTAATCREVPPGSQVRVRAPASLTLASATPTPSQVGLRRFASTTLADLGPIAPGGQALRLPRDRSRRPWVLVVGGASARVCSGG